MANTTGIKHIGRKKGTPNRMTKELRSILKHLIYEEIEIMQEHFYQLNPKEGIEFLV